MFGYIRVDKPAGQEWVKIPGGYRVTVRRTAETYFIPNPEFYKNAPVSYQGAQQASPESLARMNMGAQAMDIRLG